MKINDDLSQRAVVDSNALAWVASPETGVERRMLERDGGEVARATSIVRYAPGSRFSAHVHGGGEEYLVLEGTFSDEHGHYGPGTYVRNPPGSAHVPYSEHGCTILVKLQQMNPGQTERQVTGTREGQWEPGRVEGLERMPLYHDEESGETVYLVHFAPGAKVPDDPHPGGEELLVLDGTLEDEYGSYPKGTWLRQPDGSRHAPFSPQGCTLWVKRGHLPGDKPG